MASLHMVPVISKTYLIEQYKLQIKAHTTKIVKQIQRANDELHHICDYTLIKLKVIICLYDMIIYPSHPPHSGGDTNEKESRKYVYKKSTKFSHFSIFKEIRQLLNSWEFNFR